MTNYKRQIFSVVTAGAMLLSLITPAMADTTITISGNGSGSTNYTNVSQTNTNTVTQNNTANVTNNVTSSANTGDNEAKFNTGGDTVVNTGAATSTTNVTNALNSNAAQVAGCNCGSGANVNISGNGSFSTNQVNPLTIKNTNTVGQNNIATVTNNVSSDANSGDNEAKWNTGGTTAVITGATSSTANVSTTANVNSAVIGGQAGATDPSATFKIVGNGSGSTNWIKANLNNSNTVSQGNSATIHNYVDASAESGDNEAKFNTGGMTVVSTGTADSTANVSNLANFNSANVDCGCTFDVLAKIAGNGAGIPWEHEGDSIANTINLGLSNINSIGSYNYVPSLDNCVTADSDTGSNDAKWNTGSVLGDPTVITGGASNTTNVTNQLNSNTAGGNPVVFPTIPVGNTNVNVSFNVQALLAFLGISMS